MRAFFIILTFGFIPVTMAQFVTLGDAEPLDGSCIKLTNDLPFSEGIAYNNSRIDLNRPFEIEFDIYLGDKNDMGADGITFVLHDDPRAFEAFGTFGEFLGYGGNNAFRSTAFIAPSIAVEFDTYQNYWQNDPFSDHVAYLENGNSQHVDYFNSNNENWNIEDDLLHSFRFQWNPYRQMIRVYFDEQVVFSGKRDLLNVVFKGQNMVIWGFTASTGRKHNLQYFCLRRVARK